MCTHRQRGAEEAPPSARPARQLAAGGGRALLDLQVPRAGR